MDGSSRIEELPSSDEEEEIVEEVSALPTEPAIASGSGECDVPQTEDETDTCDEEGWTVVEASEDGDDTSKHEDYTSPAAGPVPEKDAESPSSEVDPYADVSTDERIEKSNEYKQEGNKAFLAQQYQDAIVAYTNALQMSPPSHENRAIFYSNRAACYLSQEKYDEVVADATAALEINPKYVKALVRRATAREQLGKLEGALEDYQAVIAIDPTVHQAGAAVIRLPGEIEVKRKQETDEMMGKLKDLGNMFLGNFGLSTDNFKMDQAADGNYSVQFVQNAAGEQPK